LESVVESDAAVEHGESGSGSEEELGDGVSGSGADSRSSFGHRQRSSFYDPPADFDYGISFDTFSRPPVEVVTRWRTADNAAAVTVHYPLQTGASHRLRASRLLAMLLPLLVTMLVCHSRRRYVVLAAMTSAYRLFIEIIGSGPLNGLKRAIQMHSTRASEWPLTCRTDAQYNTIQQLRNNYKHRKMDTE